MMDPIVDFYRREAEHQRWLDQLPVCHHCDEPIQQETAVHIEGCWYCDECLQDLREYTEHGW